MNTDINIFGGRKVRLGDGWWKQNVVSVFGGSEVDGSATPGDGARMTLVAVLGGVNVVVPEGSRLKVGGFGFLGGRKVDVQPRPDGPRISVNAFAVLGGVDVSAAQPATDGGAAAQPASEASAGT